MNRYKKYLSRLAMAVSFIGALGLQTAAYAQNVVVQGNSRVEASTVKSYFTGSSGE